MGTDDRRERAPSAGALIPGVALDGGRFRVERLLGAWGVRALYSAEDASTHRTTLLAELVMPGPADAGPRLRHLAHLDHRALPAIRASFQERGLLYLVFSLADGIPLDRALARRPDGVVGPAQASAWGVQICEGLSFLAAQHPPLVVGDLAPSAILLTPDDRVKLAGLGNVLGLYSTAGLVGALEPGYAAPEVYLGHLDARSDIYALGALLYRALSGVHPARYAPGALPPLRSARPEIAPELEAVIARAVAPRPEQRWPDAASFGAALAEVETALASQSAILVVEDFPADAVPWSPAPAPASVAAPAASTVSATPPTNPLPAAAEEPRSALDPAPAGAPDLTPAGQAPSSVTPPATGPVELPAAPFDPAAWLAAHPPVHATHVVPTTPRAAVPPAPSAAPRAHEAPVAPTSSEYAPAAPDAAPVPPPRQPGLFARLFGGRRGGPGVRP